jgi:inner membrane protein
MILWHLGATLLLARYVFRDPRMDLRWVALGSLLPDIIDKPVASVFFNDTFGTHRIVSHALITPVLALFVVVAVTSRGSTARKAGIAVVIGAMFHLVLDGAWIDPEAFLWPFFGLDFPAVADSAIGPLVARMVRSPMVWIGEAVGAGYLAYLWLRHLRAPGEVRRFLREGTIPLTPPRSRPAEGDASVS